MGLDPENVWTFDIENGSDDEPEIESRRLISLPKIINLISTISNL